MTAIVMEKFEECRQCGNCCRQEGYVKLDRHEVAAIAGHLGLEIEQFTEKYTALSSDRTCLNLAEKKDRGCCFLGDDGRCVINNIKPRQCRDFPLGWNYPGYEEFCRGVKTSDK